MSASAPRLRVVVADDSPIARALVRHAFEDDGRIEVVAEAFDGVDALRQVEQHHPDVLLLDLSMPRLSGFEVITRQLAHKPLPILVLTALPNQGQREQAMRALDLGALDLMFKPTEWDHASSVALCSRVRTVARVGVSPQPRRSGARPSPVPGWAAPRFLAIGASTGGPPMVARVLGALPRESSATVLIVQHMDDGFIDEYVSWLAGAAGRPVRVAVRGERPEPGDILVAPAGKDLAVSDDGTLLLEAPARGALHTPSIDALFLSLARGFGRRAAGVVLSGMGSDGALGLKHLRDAGAPTLVLEPAATQVSGMPQAAIAAGGAGVVLGLDELCTSIVSLLTAAAPRRSPDQR